MNSIPNEQLKALTEKAAQQVARGLRLPWELSKLREYGRCGVTKAKNKYDSRLGWSFPQQAKRYIYEETQRGGKLMLRGQEEMESGKRPPPSDECIKEALETFSAEDWRYFIAEFEKEDLKLLRTYLEAHWDELERSPSRSKYQSIFVAAVERGLVLLLSHPKLKQINVSGPFWAAVWWEHSRAKNREGTPRPSKRRSRMEMASPRAVAEGLSRDGVKVTAYQVERWRERMKQEPFEEFEGDFYDYLLKMADPATYERQQRRLEQSEE